LTNQITVSSSDDWRVAGRATVVAGDGSACWAADALSIRPGEGPNLTAEPSRRFHLRLLGMWRFLPTVLAANCASRSSGVRLMMLHGGHRFVDLMFKA
jgi:hypothetical protein